MAFAFHAVSVLGLDSYCQGKDLGAGSMHGSIEWFIRFLKVFLVCLILLTYECRGWTSWMFDVSVLVLT